MHMEMEEAHGRKNTYSTYITHEIHQTGISTESL